MQSDSKTTLGLTLPTDPRWAVLAESNLEDILTDHAFCEQKAASMLISLIQLHPSKEELVHSLAPVVTEEWGHFRMVLAELRKRGLKLGFQRKDDYVSRLREKRDKTGDQNRKFLDQLLICALIEARSCERFKMLSNHLEDQELQQFYHQFMVAEAGHYKLFISLAKTYFKESQVKERWDYWLGIDKQIMSSMPADSTRMH